MASFFLILLSWRNSHLYLLRKPVPWQPKRPLPSTTCFSTKTRPFPIPWLAPVNFQPNISRMYTPQLQSWVSLIRSTPMKMERLVSSETSALKTETPGDYPKNTIWQSRQSESLKSRLTYVFVSNTYVKMDLDCQSGNLSKHCTGSETLK